MSVNIDYLVIGAGPAGVRAASILAKSGKKTLLVAKDMGGYYCSGGKVVLSALLQASALYDKHKQTSSLFLDAPQTVTKVDFKRIKKFVDTSASKVKKVFAYELEESDVEFLEGSAEFLSPDTVRVTMPDNTTQDYNFGKCLIASGSRPIKLDIFSGAKPLDILSILNCENLPTSVTIIGGGLAGAEIATFFIRMGSKVTIIEKSDHMLYGLDQTIVKKYEDYLKKKDVEIITNEAPSKIERIGQKYVIFFEESKVESEEVFACIGRLPCIDGLNFDAAGIKTTDGTVVYGDDLKTDNPNVYVAGDVTNMRMHSGWAYNSAVVAAKNMLGNNIKYNMDIAPIFLSTDPEIASVGFSEDEAKKTGYDVGVVKYSFGDMSKQTLASVPPLFAKVVYDKDSKTLLGVQAIGHTASEIVKSFSVIIQAKLHIDEIEGFIYTNDLLHQIISEVADKLK